MQVGKVLACFAGERQAGAASKLQLVLYARCRGAVINTLGRACMSMYVHWSCVLGTMGCHHMYGSGTECWSSHLFTGTEYRI